MVCLDYNRDISGDSCRWRGNLGCSGVQGRGDIGPWRQVGEAASSSGEAEDAYIQSVRQDGRETSSG